MSYDVSIGEFSANYTSNVAALFYDHIPEQEGSKGGLHALHGKTGKLAVAILNEAWSRIHATKLQTWRENLKGEAVVGEPEMCAKYDAPNGWGSMVGGLIYLGQITAACAANPSKKVSVSA